MARPNDNGMDYFPLDVDYFESMELMTIAEKFGLVGEMITLKLTAWIYKSGYCIEWNDVSEKIFAKRIILDPASPVHEVVECLFDIGYLSREVYEKTGKLTSRGIQRRWQMARKASHQQSEIATEVDLIGQKDDSREDSRNVSKPSEDFAKIREDSRNVPKTSANFALKEKKRKESKVNNITPQTPHEGGGHGDEEQAVCEPGDVFGDCTDPGGLRAYSDGVVDAWNEYYGNTSQKTDRMNAPLFPKYRENLARSFNAGITLDEVRTAFRTLKGHDRFAWALHSAVKPENIKTLLAEADKAKGGKPTASTCVYEPRGREGYSEGFFKRDRERMGKK